MQNNNWKIEPQKYRKTHKCWNKARWFAHLLTARSLFFQLNNGKNYKQASQKSRIQEKYTFELCATPTTPTRRCAYCLFWRQSRKIISCLQLNGLKDKIWRNKHRKTDSTIIIYLWQLITSDNYTKTIQIIRIADIKVIQTIQNKQPSQKWKSKSSKQYSRGRKNT